jgi:cyclophilin family peptidyl-prolyl cis-trans isomerase
VLFVIAVVAGLMVYAAGEEGNSDTNPIRSGGGTAATTDLPCPEVEAPGASPRQYEEAPDLDLPEGVDYTAVIETSCGGIELDLLENKAPQTVANFIRLSEDGFYDGLEWHRIERNFVIQTGDPDGVNGHEPDGPGYTIPDELPERDREYVYGVVAMANRGPATGGSQFFIVVHDPVNRSEPAGIETLYSIFGRVTESSYDVLDKIAQMPVKGGGDAFTASRPQVPIYIESVEIREE